MGQKRSFQVLEMNDLVKYLVLSNLTKEQVLQEETQMWN